MPAGRDSTRQQGVGGRLARGPCGRLGGRSREPNFRLKRLQALREVTGQTAGRRGAHLLSLVAHGPALPTAQPCPRPRRASEPACLPSFLPSSLPAPASCPQPRAKVEGWRVWDAAQAGVSGGAGLPAPWALILSRAEPRAEWSCLQTRSFQPARGAGLEGRGCQAARPLTPPPAGAVRSFLRAPPHSSALPPRSPKPRHFWAQVRTPCSPGRPLQAPRPCSVLLVSCQLPSCFCFPGKRLR